MTRAIVIGKFYPPHLGHKFLIDYATDHSDELTVLICDSPRYDIPALKRQEWLQRIHPNVTVLIIPDIEDDDNSQAWADHTLAFLGYTPDVIFSSESYGITYAKCMHTTHVMVDQARTNVPISATRVRANLLAEWDFLHPVVKADLALRVVIVGAESTGTTTLAQSLAQKLKVPWVPEYGRLYSEAFLHTKHDWKDQEFVHIAKMQQELEKQAAAQSNGLIICDTNATATTIWQQRYMGHITPEVAEIAAQDKADYYLLTGDEIPFVQDGTRDGEHIRHDMHQTFIKTLEQQRVPFKVVAGMKNVRLRKAISAVQATMRSADATAAFAQQAARSLPAAQLR